jgi:chromosome segregation ATPase
LSHCTYSFTISACSVDSKSASRKKISQLERDAALASRDLNVQLKEAQTAKATAEKESARAKARLEALEERLAELESLPALLQRAHKEAAAHDRAKPHRSARPPAGKATKKKSRSARAT